MNSIQEIKTSQLHYRRLFEAGQDGILILDAETGTITDVDTFLHGVGSLLLREIRGEDTACRYGGDEFILILPDSSREVLRQRAELICRCARQFHLQFEGQSIATLTLSVGVAVFPEHGATSTAILRTVDAAL